MGMKKVPGSRHFLSFYFEFIRLTLFCRRCCGSGGRSCRGVRDPQFLLHGWGEVGQHGLVEIGQRPCRSVEDCQVAACGRNLVDSGLGLVDDRGQQLVVTLLEILLCDLFEIVAALDEIIQFLLFELTDRTASDMVEKFLLNS